jgi:hypothetical protein
MPHQTIVEPQVGDPTTAEWGQSVAQELAYLYTLALSAIGSREIILNGSFETDTDSDGEPDGWTIVEFTGGTFLLDESTVAADGKSRHGKRAAKLTAAAGTGGGTLTSTDAFECTPGRILEFSWQMKSSAAGVRNKVDILFFDSTLVATTTDNIFDNSTTNPTDWTLFHSFVVVPATARYCKIKLTGADSSDATNGDVWFDDVKVFSKQPVFAREIQFTAAGTFQWQCPAGVYLAQFAAIGAGGGGGGANTQAAAGGGSGGMVTSVLAVVPGTLYPVVVGAGGAGGNSAPNAGSAGANSTVNGLTGGGGGGGAITSGAGGTAGSAAGGDINNAGNAGSVRAGTEDGGNGGASVWSGDIALGGIDIGNIAAESGRLYGAGGGGGEDVNGNGGNGADGAVFIRW